MKNVGRLTLLIVLFIGSVVLTAYISHFITLKYVTNRQEITNESDRTTCNDTNLMIDKLPPYVKNNTYAIALLRKECSYVTDSFQQDVNEDGKDEIFLQTTRLFCGNASCKDRKIHILSSDNQLFYASGYDIHFEKSTNKGEFSVVEQIRHWNDPPCCSSQVLVITYKYINQGELRFEPINTFIRQVQ